AAYGHQELPFERLVEVLNPARSLSRHPLFQVMLAFEAGEAGTGTFTLPGLAVTPQPIATASAKFDLSVGLIERRSSDGTPGGIDGVLEYASDLFDAASVALLGERLLRLLAAVAGDAGRALGTLPILDEAERDTMLRVWNDTAPGGAQGAAIDGERALAAAGPAQTASGLPLTLPALLAAQALRTPDAVAVLFEERRLSYAELEAHANALAHHLRGLGVGPETVVGLLGILKAGAAYLPLDPDYPPERLAFMLQDAGGGVLVTQGALTERLPAATVAGLTLVRLDADWPVIARQPATAPDLDLDPRHPAYVIYTSGSTGTPKGVVVS